MEFQVEPGQQPLKNLKRSKFLKASVIIIDLYTDICQNNILKITPLFESKNFHTAQIKRNRMKTNRPNKTHKSSKYKNMKKKILPFTSICISVIK